MSLPMPSPKHLIENSINGVSPVNRVSTASLTQTSDLQQSRDRFHALGSSAVSTIELLNLILGGKRALGNHLYEYLSVDQLDPFQRLREISVEELSTLLGIGPVKACRLVAAIELGKRVFHPSPPRGSVIDTPELAVAAVAQQLMWEAQERFAVLLLSVKHRLLGTHVVTIGSAIETLAPPREVFRMAIRCGATQILLAHNHPSGDVTASAEDLSLTQQFINAGSILSIPVVDHLILGQGNHCSLRRTTTLWADCQEATSWSLD